MATVSIVGFFRCSGFDHLARFVTDAPANQWGQRFVIYQDGHTVKWNYQNAGCAEDWLPVAQVSDTINQGSGKSEARELAACQQLIDSGLVKPDDKRPFAIDA